MKLFETIFFFTGLLNNILLIIIFAFRKIKKIKWMKTVGYIYFILALPALFLIILSAVQNKPVNYIIFLIIFIAYLILEFIYDFLLKIPFRKNPKLLWPYLVLYFAMNYGFFAMAWKYSLPQGIVIGGLFIAQIFLNVISHKALE